MRLVPPETVAPLEEIDVTMENAAPIFSEIGSAPEHAKEADAVIQGEKASMPLKEGQIQYLINARWEPKSWNGV